MARMNQVHLLGYLTADPELKQTPAGVSVCPFSIAVNRKHTREGGPACDFINVVAWRERAEFVGKFFKKGKPILVVGQLQSRTWADKDGNRRTAWEVVADELTFVSSAKEDGAPTANENCAVQQSYMPDAYKPSASVADFEPVTDDNLPF